MCMSPSENRGGDVHGRYSEEFQIPIEMKEHKRILDSPKIFNVVVGSVGFNVSAYPDLTFHFFLWSG